MSEIGDKAAGEDKAYREALDFLYSFINQDKQRVDRYRENKMNSVERMAHMLAALGEPHRPFPSMHIAGTKGKGSVAAMCAAALRASDLRVGLFTSPHLREFRERIRLLTPEDSDGRIAQHDFVALMEQVKPVLTEELGIIWFEIVTLIAFLYFAQQKVDVAVVEVGLGGRLDATNILTPLVSVITSLSLDHTQYLGHTLAQIAMEKGGIIKPGVPVVTAGQKPEALAELLAIAAKRHSPITVVGEEWQFAEEARLPNGRHKLIITASAAPDFIPPGSAFPLALAGEHQMENATVAIAALNAVRPAFPGLTAGHLFVGLTQVEWNGRLQTVHQAANTPTFLVDCAHNQDSAAKLAHALTHDFTYNRLWLIFGAPEDKDISSMVDLLFPLAEMTIVTNTGHPRSINPDNLGQMAAERGLPILITYSAAEALARAWQLAVPGDLICATGSIIIVGDLLHEWDQSQEALLQSSLVSL